jgi:hypothetical protein
MEQCDIEQMQKLWIVKQQRTSWVSACISPPAIINHVKDTCDRQMKTLLSVKQQRTDWNSTCISLPAIIKQNKDIVTPEQMKTLLIAKEQRTGRAPTCSFIPAIIEHIKQACDCEATSPGIPGALAVSNSLTDETHL